MMKILKVIIRLICWPFVALFFLSFVAIVLWRWLYADGFDEYDKRFIRVYISFLCEPARLIIQFFGVLFTAILATASNNPEQEFMENNND